MIEQAKTTYRDEEGNLWRVYELDKLDDNSKKKLIEEFDFEIKTIKDNGETIYKLVDVQEANLGDIESEEFETLDGIIYRLENYWDDYNIKFE